MARLTAGAVQQAEGWASCCARGEGAVGGAGHVQGSPRGIRGDSFAAPRCPQQHGALPPRQPGSGGLLTPSSLALQCTKQLISERFGRGSRTVDLELETQIELLRETKRKYECVLQLARALTNHFYSLVQTQHALGDAFADLSQKSPELQVCPLGRWRVPCLCLCGSPSCLGRRPRDPNQPRALQHSWGRLAAPQHPRCARRSGRRLGITVLGEGRGAGESAKSRVPAAGARPILGAWEERGVLAGSDPDSSSSPRRSLVTMRKRRNCSARMEKHYWGLSTSLSPASTHW